MRDRDETMQVDRSSVSAAKAAIQVICLGSGGGPSEDNVTGLLVRSTAANWVRGSVLAVDAGSHLAAITRILEKEFPLVSRSPPPPPPAADSASDDQSSSAPSSPASRCGQPVPQPVVLESGPFAGFPFPHTSARANAAHVVQSHVETYLITHPHLDHLSGFAINTAAFHATSRPKRLAALPFTVDAIKKHIFNDVIWPNMTDEDGGVGFVTFQRLKEGGDVMVGEGEGRGYIEVCEGLGVKGFKISHGRPTNSSGPGRSPRHSLGNMSDSLGPTQSFDSRTMSISMANGLHGGAFGTPNHGHQSPGGPQGPNNLGPEHQPTCVVDSTAYFVRDTATSKELLIFGDVEPDSISNAPRLFGLWNEAAPKIAAGVLKGIFIECSYDDSQADAFLFGHMAPRHIVAEMHSLAEMVREEKSNRALEKLQRKRKRSKQEWTLGSSALADAIERKRTRSLAGRVDASTPLRRGSIPVSVLEEQTMSPSTSAASPQIPIVRHPVSSAEPILKGLRVVIIHVKDTLKDGPHVSESILQQLNEHAQALEVTEGVTLGCEFVVSESGRDYFF